MEVLKVFETIPMTSCLLDDLEYYESRERVMAEKEKLYNKHL
jgi:hypothetical protein